MQKNIFPWIVVFCLLPLKSMAADPVIEDEVAQRREARERGVAALKRIQGVDGSFNQNEPGMTPLAVITLLECGVPVTDESIQKAVPVVRQLAISTNRTYPISLCILCLDRLGDPNDAPLIEALTVRLLAGQTTSGAWDYVCVDSINPEEIRRLSGQVQQRTQLIARPRGENQQGDQVIVRRTIKDLAPETQTQLANLARLVQKPAVFRGRWDHSNTQFATIALWVSRKHGLPVDQALLLLDTHYRKTQHADGGWGYGGTNFQTDGSSRTTMTCAGLLGLAVSHGVVASSDILAKKGNKPDPSMDPVLIKGLNVIASTIGNPMANKQRVRGAGPRMIEPQMMGAIYYYLWSLERVSVALGLESFGGKDWYRWGLQIVLDSQQPDGTWQGQYGSYGADTCFALLFMQRANLAKDLTVALRGKMRDPTVTTLKAGGPDNQPVRIKPGMEETQSKQDLETKLDPFRTGNSNPERNNPTQVLKPTETTSRASTESKPAGQTLEELLKSPVTQQERLILQLRDSTGPESTGTLASAIPRLNEDLKKKAREALAERLASMKDSTLQAYFKHEATELRRAAVLASAMKDSKSLIPNVIDLLGDRDMQVSRAAQVALRELTGQNLGADRQAWLNWLNKKNR